MPDLNRRELAVMVPLIVVHRLAGRLSGAGAAADGRRRDQVRHERETRGVTCRSKSSEAGR